MKPSPLKEIAERLLAARAARAAACPVPEPSKRRLPLARGQALELATGEKIDARAMRRERALEIRAQYPHLSYDFAPTPGDTEVDPFSYDIIVVAFSGGKDSMALVLLLLLLGVPKDRIELWHHDVDGGEGSTLMDWPCTRDYCRKVADALGLTLYFSWKVGGFEREMTKTNARTAGYKFETPGGGLEETGGDDGQIATRNHFPLPIGDLSRRWCSAYVKIMVMDTAIRNQDRFFGRRTLVLTGERAEESPKRATYNVIEPHRSYLPKPGKTSRNPRHVDVWRPILRWPEAEVWKIIERFGVNPHPAYWLGWGRVSCAPCIFGSPDQWASLRVVNPEQFQAVADYEEQFGKTIAMPDKDDPRWRERGPTVIEQADMGSPFAGMRTRWIRAAVSREYREPVFLDPWELPAGAILGDGSGPT